MPWTLEDEKKWFEGFWRQKHPEPKDLDTEHAKRTRFAGFWKGAEHLFPRHTPRSGSRWLATAQYSAVEAWFDEVDILANCPLPGRKGLTPAAGTTEVSVDRAEGYSVVFTSEETAMINAESALSLGKKISSLRQITGFRRLQQGNVRQSDGEDLGF